MKEEIAFPVCPHCDGIEGLFEEAAWQGRAIWWPIAYAEAKEGESVGTIVGLAGSEKVRCEMCEKESTAEEVAKATAALVE
jgi:hypothetical protein